MASFLRVLPRGFRAFSTKITPLQYEKAANETLERMTDYLDTLPESINVPPEFDVSHAMGVLTVVISKEVGTYVINKQSPNMQIWLSSPVSGPKRYDLVDGRWVYLHDNEHLDHLLTHEFRKIFGDDNIDFKEHMY